MRQTSSVVHLAIDELLPSRSSAAPGFVDFLEKLGDAGIPCVWLTQRTRLQIDEPRRKLGQRDPFIAEDGCGLFLPEDYFHLRPQTRRSGGSKGRTEDAATVRLGRFTCLPVAQRQPAAAEALEALAEETGISVVPLRSLPPRQLAQNAGLHLREAELARQRDFDELFFFAGATPGQVESFKAAAQGQAIQVRQRGALWSLAIGADAAKCVRQLAKLYDRALHGHARSVGIAVGQSPEPFFSACDRGILLTVGKEEREEKEERAQSKCARVLRVPLDEPRLWERLTEYIAGS